MDVYKEERPWGGFERITNNETSTVKIITVAPGGLLSYQYHEHRDEYWRVVNGAGYVIIDDERQAALPGTEFYIARGTKHRMGSEKDGEQGGGMQVLEVSLGEFDENDIIRLEDQYGRSEQAQNE